MSEPQNIASAPANDHASRNLATRIWHNLDIASAVAFIGAGLFGFIGAANNVRHTFWNNFIEGFRQIDTPFAAITKAYKEKFVQTPLDYAEGRITADQYRNTMRNHARNYRNEVNTKLLHEFNIPTDGIEGWTVGTVKRFKELGLNGKVHTALGFATVAAISIGAISLLRHNRNILNNVDDKLDDLRHDLLQEQAQGR